MERAVIHFGADRELSSIRPSDVRGWVEILRETSNGRGLLCTECDERGKIRDEEPVADCPECGEKWRIGPLSDKTVRDHLNSFSNLFRRAAGEEAVPPGHNPVKAWLDSVEDNEKPTRGRTKEADWLEPHEAVLLLESARTWKQEETGGAPNCSFAYPLIATVLLTGGRKSEILGLEVGDLDLSERHVICFEPNDHRRIKTDKSVRTVPVWPQLRGILGEYLAAEKTPESCLLFPSPRTGKMIQDFRRTLAVRLLRGGDSVPQAAAHLLRRPDPNRRARAPGEPLHSGPRARTLLNPADRAPLRTTTHELADTGRGGRVSARNLRGGDRRLAPRPAVGGVGWDHPKTLRRGGGDLLVDADLGCPPLPTRLLLRLKVEIREFLKILLLARKLALPLNSLPERLNVDTVLFKMVEERVDET